MDLEFKAKIEGDIPHNMITLLNSSKIKFEIVESHTPRYEVKSIANVMDENALRAAGLTHMIVDNEKISLKGFYKLESDARFIAFLLNEEEERAKRRMKAKL